MAQGKLTLHGVASSTCTGRVLVTLFEKGVEDFELKVVNVRKGEGKTPEHKSLQVRLYLCQSCTTFGGLKLVADFEFLCSLQPFGLIPVLQDGDLTLFGMSLCNILILMTVSVLLVVSIYELDMKSGVSSKSFS